MASPERAANRDSSWNDDMPWDFYARPQSDVDEVAESDKPIVIVLAAENQPPMTSIYTDKDWS